MSRCRPPNSRSPTGGYRICRLARGNAPSPKADRAGGFPADYVAVVATGLTFKPGETTKRIVVAVNGDPSDEADETFTVTISNPTGATLAGGRAIGTIVDDDP